MAELGISYAQRLWDAWKDYEKAHGALSGVQLAKRVEVRIRRPFDDSKLSKIRQGKRRATVDEHYALAAELETDPDQLAGQGIGQFFPVEKRRIKPVSGATRQNRKGE